jgi:polyketide biosynthesis enoyl-CoA hydratase PksH
VNYKTLKVRFEENICFIQIYIPENDNTISDQLIMDFQDILMICKEKSTVIIIEGLPEYFCFGANFKGMEQEASQGKDVNNNPQPLYEVWQDLATGPFISIAHVRGKANAGGVGFVAACDIVLADKTAVFSLSELLFGIFPACVLPFLIRKIGIQKTNYMTCMTQPIPVEKACSWGLVDDYHEQSENLIRKHLLRLRLLSKKAISRYKSYINNIAQPLERSKELAIKANLEVFSDPENMKGIINFVETGKFPWEK